MVKKWLRFLDLKSDADNVDEIQQSIKNGIIFKGTNLWILVFAIMQQIRKVNQNWENIGSLCNRCVLQGYRIQIPDNSIIFNWLVFIHYDGGN
jgi:hypothetical protein